MEIKAKRNSKKYAAKKTLRDEWLMEEYQLSNRVTSAASVDNIVTEDDPGLTLVLLRVFPKHIFLRGVVPTPPLDYQY